ncbi:MAG: leucyl/phenylalanyl-tRNA--protein transferase [Deltaproteobacteria bacterium]|nr:MAG: leucyl/phenylalanyl-tRNA--protein transferase [Deltaproteobacteria bacterium]
MPVYRLGAEHAFPPPEAAEPSGLLAVGGDLAPERLLRAYSLGIFPWYSDPDPILWFSPDPRMVLVPSELRVSRSLRRAIRRGGCEVRLDTAFERVIAACAAVERPDDAGTWITPDMIDAYVRLHRLGYAHSVEAWRDGRLIGGLYGVSIGGSFFGESMFARESDASKVAFVKLVRQLHAWNFDLIDCQVRTPHLARFGATDWPRARFLAALAKSLERETRRGAWRFDAEPDGGVRAAH